VGTEKPGDYLHVNFLCTSFLFVDDSTGKRVWSPNNDDVNPIFLTMSNMKFNDQYIIMFCDA
jgi:hypothetical protein